MGFESLWLRAKAGTGKSEASVDIGQGQRQPGRASPMTEGYVRARHGSQATPTR